MNLDVDSGRILLNIYSSLNEFEISSSEIVYEYFMTITRHEVMKLEFMSKTYINTDFNYVYQEKGTNMA